MAEEEGEEAVAAAQGRAKALQERIASRLKDLGATVDALELIPGEDRDKALAEQRKLRETYARLQEWTGDVWKSSGAEQDEELQRQAAELVASTQDLWKDLNERQEVKQLLAAFQKKLTDRGGDSQANQQLVEKLKQKVVDNRESVQGIFKLAPSVLEALNSKLDQASSGAGEGEGGDEKTNLTVSAVLSQIDKRSGGRVKINEDLVKDLKDQSVDKALADKAQEALVPMLKSRVGYLGEALEGFKQGGRHDEMISRGMKFVNEKALLDKLNGLDGSTNVEELLDWSERLVRDEKARNDMIDKVKDTVLDFLISYLPDVKIPPIEGDKEGVLYKIENIDMSGFKVRKEHVRVEMNGFTAIAKGVPFFTVSVSNVSAALKDIQWSIIQDYFPRMSAGGLADAQIIKGAVELSLQLIKSPYEEEGTDSDAGSNDVVAGKDGARKLAGGWKPQLLLASCEVSIGQIDVQVRETQFSWLYNTMSELFSESLRNYIESLLQDTLMEHIAGLGESLNSFVHNNWPMVASFLDVNIDQLPKAEVAEAYVNSKRLEKLRKSNRKGVYTTTFAEKGQIGIAFEQQMEFVVVKCFRRGPNDVVLPAERQGEVKVGDVLVAFNGQQVTSLPLGRVMERLRRARRPLHLTFMVPFESGRARKSPVALNGAGSKPRHPQKEQRQKQQQQQQQSSSRRSAPEESVVVDVEFVEKRLYLLLSSRWAEELDRCDPQGFSSYVKGFKKREDGSDGPVEAGGKVRPGMILVAANSQNLMGKGFTAVHQVIRGMPRPLKLRFAQDSEYEVKFDKKLPIDIRVSCMPGGFFVITRLVPVKGPGEEQCGAVLVKGDVLKSVNGETVEPGNFNRTIGHLKSCPRPLTLEFSRPPNSETICQAVFDEGPIGLVFYRSQENNAVFKAFSAFPGPAKEKNIQVGHVLLEVNGQALQNGVHDEQSVHSLLSSGPRVRLRLRDMTIHEAAVQGLG